jgi:hypothetical protein
VINLVDTETAIRIVGNAGIAIGFVILYILSMRVVRAFSLGTMSRLFKSVSLVLLFFAIKEAGEVAFLLAPVLQQAELVWDVGVEIIFLLIIAVGILPVVKMVRNLHSEGPTQTVGNPAVGDPISDGRLLADVLHSAMTALAGIMGPSVVYGVAARACLPILEKTGRVSDKAWIEKFLPSELRPHLAPQAETLPIES